MNKQSFKFIHLKLLLILFLSTWSFMAAAQFYNGSQLSFGKNRVQYIDRFWSYYRFETFDTYFYQQGKPLAIFTAKYFTSIRKSIEDKLQTQYDDKVQFVIFNKISDLKQSNVGFISDDYYNIGGKTHIVGSKVFLYFNGDYADFARQIRAGYAHILINQLVFGDGITAMIKNSTLLSLPDWYLQGLISYITEEWNVETDNYVRDGVMSGNYSNFYTLPAEQAAYAGHSFWNFIALRYGQGVIPNVLFMTRISRNVENGFLYVLGITYKSLMRDWMSFYQEAYADEEARGKLSEEETIPVKNKKNTHVYSVRTSPDNVYTAYATNIMGKNRVFLRNNENGKTKRLLKQGHKLDEKNDLSYPIIDWHPSGKILAIIREEKGITMLYLYTTDDKKMEKRPIFHFDKILHFSYAPSGRMMVLSGIINGKTNLYTYNIAANTFEVITNDSYNDFDPVFHDKERYIIFSSNRISDTLNAEKPDEIFTDFSPARNLFIYDYSQKKPIVRKITSNSYTNAIKPQSDGNKTFFFLSDNNGIFNRYSGRFDSTVSHVDTTVHYKYFAVVNPLTDYKRSILDHYINHDKNSLTNLTYNNGKYSVFKSDTEAPANLINPKKTHYFKKLDTDRLIKETEKKNDSTDNILNDKGKRKRLIIISPTDTTDSQPKVDIENYVFTNEKAPEKPSDDTLTENENDTTAHDFNAFYLPKQRNYMVEYTIDNMVNQLDFGYLNSSYQTFTGGKNPIFINPAFNALFKLGLTDLLEDNRIVGGVRFSLNLDQSEYLLSYEMLAKRLEKQVIFYRQKFDNLINANTLIRNTSYMGYYLVKWPFNNVLSIKGTASYRYDNGVYLATDLETIKKPNLTAHWGGIKGELIFDNTRNQGNNIYFGSRYKVFGEYFRRINRNASDLYVVGADFRHYTPIYKTFIWANRLAGSTSFGKHKLIYYMGGVDTWLFPRFNDSVSIDETQNYAYQTLATNMRGFIQNIRNGNNFAVFNSELRFPAVRFFSKKPLKSELLNSFQVIGFFDVGTAWNGLSPYYADNPFFTQVYDSPFTPYKITVYTQKEPIVAGYGLGMRAKVLGYFLRTDYAWGIEDGVVRKPVFYLSLSLDF